MGENEGAPPLAPPDARDRRRIEQFRADIGEFRQTGNANFPVLGPPLMLTIRMGGRVQAYGCARGTWEVEVLVCALLSYFLPWEGCSVMADSFTDQFLPEGGGTHVQITGPRVYCWLAREGIVASPPPEWGWSIDPPPPARCPDGEDIPF